MLIINHTTKNIILSPYKFLYSPKKCHCLSVLIFFSLTIQLLPKLATPGETTLTYRFGTYLCYFKGLKV